MNKFVSINFCGSKIVEYDDTFPIANCSAFIFDWKIRNNFRIDRFCACACVCEQSANPTR